MKKLFYSLLFCNSFFIAIYSAQTIQQRQAEFDVLYFDRDYFKNDQNFEKLRHILLHLMKTVGKISAYCEIQEHGKSADVDELTNAALPDLYLHALQIANLFDVDLSKKYQQRLDFLAERNKNETLIDEEVEYI